MKYFQSPWACCVLRLLHRTELFYVLERAEGRLIDYFLSIIERAHTLRGKSASFHIKGSQMLVCIQTTKGCPTHSPG